MKRILALIIAVIMICSLVACESINKEEMIAQAKEMVLGEVYRTVHTASGNKRTFTYVFNEDGSVYHIEEVENDERQSKSDGTFDNPEYVVESKDEVFIKMSNHDIVRVSFKNGEPDSVWVNFSGSYYIAVKYTNAYNASVE